MKRLSSALNVLLLLFLLVACSTRKTEVNTTEYPYIVVKPAHVNIDDPNLSLVYKDVSKDVAIYFRTDYVPSVPETGAYVSDSTGRIFGVVTEVDTYSFYFKLDEESSISRGDSGTFIYSDGEYIGFVSSVSVSNEVHVVCY